jgi:hypothetical protein
MRIALTFFGGMVFASSWWVAAIWPHYNGGAMFAAPIVLTVAVIICAAFIAMDER